jgi:membrane protein
MRAPSVRRVLLLSRSLRERFRADDLGTQASAWAHTAFLSLFPVMLLGLFVAGTLVSGRTGTELRDGFASLPGIGSLLGRYQEELVVPGRGLGVVAVVGLVSTAAGLADRTSATLGRIFGAPDPGLVRRRLRGLVAVVMLGTLLLSGVVASAIIATVDLPGTIGFLGRVGSFVALACLEAVFFLSSYRLLTPRSDRSWRDHLPGAVAMTLGWNALKVVGGLIVARIALRAGALYGSIGAVFGIVVFLRLAALLYFAGAELSVVLAEGRRRSLGS